MGNTMGKSFNRINNQQSWYKTNKTCPFKRRIHSKKHPFGNVTFHIVERTEWETTAKRRENVLKHQHRTLEHDEHNEKDEEKIQKRSRIINYTASSFKPFLNWQMDFENVNHKFYNKIDNLELHSILNYL